MLFRKIFEIAKNVIVVCKTEIDTESRGRNKKPKLSKITLYHWGVQRKVTFIYYIHFDNLLHLNILYNLQI